MIVAILWIGISAVHGHDLFHVLQKWASFPVFTSRSSLSSTNEFTDLFQEIPWDIKLKILAEQKLDLADVTSIPLGLLYTLPGHLLPKPANGSNGSLINLLLRQNIDSNPNLDVEESFSQFLDQGDSFHVSNFLRSRNQSTGLPNLSNPCRLVPYLDTGIDDCQVDPVFPKQQNCLILKRFVDIERPVQLWSLPTIHKIGPLLYCLPSVTLSDLSGLRMMAQDGMDLNISNRYWSQAQNQSLFQSASMAEVLPKGLRSLVPAKLVLDGALSGTFSSIQGMHDLMRTMPFLSSYACFLHCKKHVQFLTKPEKMLPFLNFLPSFELKHYAPVLLIHLQSTTVDLKFEQRVYVQLLEVWIEMEQDDWLDILLKSPSQSFQRIILGLNCLQVRNAPTMLVIPMIHLFNQRSEHLPELRLRNCLVHGVQNVLSVRSEFDPTTGQSFLDQLEPLEIKVIGGYILSGMEPSQIRSMADMHRRTKVLRAISEEPLSNLFRVLDISALKHFANLHLRDLTLMSTNVSGIDLGSLLYFLDLDHFTSNDQMVKSLVPRLKGPICTDESTFNGWSAILQILWNDKPTTTAAELYDLGDSIVLLPLTKIKEIDKDVLGFVAPYLFERSHYLKEFRNTEHEANIQFLGQCVTFLNKQGMDPRFIQVRVFHTLRYLETLTNRPKNGRFKRNLSERELDQVRRGFEAARAYWKYLHDNNFLTQDQKTKARVIFSNFVQEIAREQRRLLNLNDSISNRDVSATLHNLITEGLLSESIEQEFHEFSDRLRVKVVHQVENVLKVNFAEPKYLPEGPLKTELQEIFGLHHEVTQATSTASPTKEIKPSSGSIERKIEIPFDLFEGLDHLLVDTMLDQLGPPAKKTKTASTPVNSGTSGEQTLTQPSKVHQEFMSEAKMKSTISRFKYSGDSIFLSESTLKAVDDSIVKEWDVKRILANLDILGRTNELSTSTKSILWNKVHADLIPGTILGSNTILNLGNLLQVVKTVKSISASMLFSQDFGFEAISELSSKLKNGAKIEFARQVDDLLVCQRADQNNDHIKLLLASVQPIWCYLNSENLSEFFRNCPKVLPDLIVLFPGMPLCSESQSDTLLTFLNSTAKMFGPFGNWSSSDATSMGTIIGGLKSEALLKIPPTAWRGLTDFGYQQLEQNIDLALLPAQKKQIPLEFLGDTINRVD